MIAIYLVYGLAFFTLGLATFLESRRKSVLLLGRQLPWLAAFGLTHSLVEWSEMLVLYGPPESTRQVLITLHIVMLPLSALLLIRFGTGLISEGGPLPQWLQLFPVVFIIPVVLLTAYALAITLTEPDMKTASDIWSRYLLYIPGGLLTTAGFLRQSNELSLVKSRKVRNMMYGAAAAFCAYALFAGVIVPPAPYGLAPWLNYDTIQRVTHLPVQAWRTFAALGVTIFVVRAYDVFKLEREQQLASLNLMRKQAEEALQREREQAQEAQLCLQIEARHDAETWVNTLVQIARHIAHMETAEVVLLHIAQQAQCLLKTNTVSLGLFDETGQCLVLQYQATTAKTFALNPAITVENNELVRMLRSGRSYRFPQDIGAVSVTWYCPTVRKEIKAAAVVPLQFDGQVVGGLWAARFTPTPFTSAQLFGLENLADQVVIALQHATMAAQLQTVATLEERSRIAREMHDGLAQVLGYLSLQIQTLEAYTRQGQQEELLAEIHKARENIRLAQADVRENILSLRTTLAGGARLVSAIQEYVEEFGIHTKTKARFVNTVERSLDLSPMAEVQLVRILQEALTNVRKHARAQHVLVQLSTQDNGLAIIIADDGVGLVSNGEEQHFGLQTMAERASSVGGHFDVCSVPQQGTEVRLWLPSLR